jgi:hypothetical protein
MKFTTQFNFYYLLLILIALNSSSKWKKKRHFLMITKRGVYFQLLNQELVKCRESVGLEKLIHDVFEINNYNNLVRPTQANTGLTLVETELKLLQISLDEKFQEMISTVWIEMVIKFINS